MAFMLKIRWDIEPGREGDFRDSQRELCAVMRDDHPGVICYHVEYPARDVSEWTEIYANDAAFKAHLDNAKGKGPLARVIDACAKITCRCFGDPDAASRQMLAGFGTTYEVSAEASFVLHPRADAKSPV